MVRKHSKTDSRFFEDIPKVKVDPRDEILKKYKIRMSLKETREHLVNENIEIRKKIYSYSQEINDIEKQIDEMVKDAS